MMFRIVKMFTIPHTLPKKFNIYHTPPDKLTTHWFSTLAELTDEHHPSTRKEEVSSEIWSNLV